VGNQRESKMRELCKSRCQLENIEKAQIKLVELVRNLVAHGDAWEGKLRGNWRMEWVVSTLTPPLNMVYPALLKLMRTPRLPAVY